MKEETLKKIREDYNRRKDNKEKCLKTEKRIKELEKNKAVKEYLRLIEEKEDNTFDIESTDEDLMEKAYRKYEATLGKTNGIYVYLGTFRNSSESDIVHGPSVQRMKRNDPNAEYSQYINIEDRFDAVSISISDREEFERTHKIIFANTLLGTKEYYRLQTLFIKKCIETSQEEAISAILKK